MSRRLIAVLVAFAVAIATLASSAALGSSAALSADASTALFGGPGDNHYAGAAWTYGTQPTLTTPIAPRR